MADLDLSEQERQRIYTTVIFLRTHTKHLHQIAVDKPQPNDLWLAISHLREAQRELAPYLPASNLHTD